MIHLSYLSWSSYEPSDTARYAVASVSVWPLMGATLCPESARYATVFLAVGEHATVWAIEGQLRQGLGDPAQLPEHFASPQKKAK